MAKVSGGSDRFKWEAVNWRRSDGRKFSGGPSSGALHNADRITVKVTPADGGRGSKHFVIHGPWDDLDILDDIVDAAMDSAYDDAF